MGNLKAREGLCRVLVLVLRSKEKAVRSTLTPLLCSAGRAAHHYFEKQRAEGGHQLQMSRASHPPSVAVVRFGRKWCLEVLVKFLSNSTFYLLCPSFVNYHTQYNGNKLWGRRRNALHREFVFSLLFVHTDTFYTHIMLMHIQFLL